MLELRKGDQIIFLVDRSGSMATSDVNGDTRYNAVRETIKAFVRDAVKFDADGVSVHFFNNKVEMHPDVATAEMVDQLIDSHRTGGGTATHLALQAAFNEHKRKQSSATYVMCFTDGEPDDESLVEGAIVAITNAISSPEEFRVLIATVGQRTPALSAWLSRLDSNLKGAKCDIVGVAELEGLDFSSAVADLIGSTTTAGEAAAGNTAGKATTHI